MALPIPFPYIRSLPQADQLRLKRDFDAVLDQVGPPRVFDAYVDSEALANDPDNLVFTTPFAAIQYVADTLGKQWVNIGWFAPNNPTSASTETADYAGSNNCYVSIEAIGIDTTGGLSQIFAPSSTKAVNWNLQGFADSHVKMRGVALRGINLTSSIAYSTSFSTFPAGTVVVYAENCSFQYTAHGQLCANGGVFVNCSFIGMALTSTGSPGSPFYLFNCFINRMLDVTMTSSIISRGCVFTNVGNATFQGPVFIAEDSTWTQYSSGTSISVGTLNFNSAATTRIHISSAGEDGSLDQGVAINITAAIPYVWLEGNFWSIVAAAPPASSGLSNATIHHIAAHCTKTFDVAGPAILSLSAQFGGNFLRGEGLSGSVVCGGNINAGIALSFVGIHDSTITAAFQAYTTPSAGGIAYAIDAASSNSVIVEEGHELFPGASTNASATVLVINHGTTFPISGRDSTGDALNKDMLPAWLGGEPLPGVTTIPTPASTATGVDLRDFEHEWIAELSTGVQTIPPATPGSAPTGAAGGSLASTYPNPTFAGRDASVDKINQDMLPALLLPTPGTNIAGGDLAGTLPNPQLAWNPSNPSCVTSTNVALPTCTYNNGINGFGATLTANANGILTSASTNGLTVNVGERLFVSGEAASQNDGIYVVTSVGSAGTTWVLTRAIDLCRSNQFVGASFVVVGGTLGNVLAAITNRGAFTVGTTPITATAVAALPTGLASGALNGNFPAPIFAGRDASVDEINKDLAPGLFLPDGTGVNSPQGMLAGFVLPVGVPAVGNMLTIDNLFTKRWIWQSPIISGTGAGGGLQGTYPNPTLLLEVARTVDTTLQSVASATETIITAAATTFTAVAGVKYRITLEGTFRNLAAAVASLTFRIKDGTTLIEQARIVGAAPINNTGDVVVKTSVETTLSAGSHTINITMQSSSASGVSNLATNWPIVVTVDAVA